MKVNYSNKIKLEKLITAKLYVYIVLYIILSKYYVVIIQHIFIF